MNKFNDKPYLITTTGWFFAPDGHQYRAVWGKVEIVSDSDTLGIKTNMRSTNWYAVVGEGGKQMIVAGCQIFYAIQSEDKPNTEPIIEKRQSDSLAKDFEAVEQSRIYIAQ